MDKRISSKTAGVCAAIIMSLFMSSCNPTPWRGIDNAGEVFFENKELVFLVRDYLVQSEYDSISIAPHMEKGIMFVNQVKVPYVPIDNEEVEEAMNVLRENGYSSFSKYNSCIKISMRTSVNVSYGVAFSTTGHVLDESSFDFLTLIEPLTEEGWYYYEEDFPEWRVRDG